MAMTQRKEDRKGGWWCWGPRVLLLISLFLKYSKFPEMKVQKPQALRGTGFPSPPTPRDPT